jgi:hypothetical protein
VAVEDDKAAILRAYAHSRILSGGIEVCTEDQWIADAQALLAGRIWKVMHSGITFSISRQSGQVVDLEPRPDLPKLPPLLPEGEKPWQDEAFSELCSSAVAPRATRQKWILGEPALTHSDKWGLIWRVDFAYHHTSPVLDINSRIIFWKGSDGELRITIRRLSIQ